MELKTITFCTENEQVFHCFGTCVMKNECLHQLVVTYFTTYIRLSLRIFKRPALNWWPTECWKNFKLTLGCSIPTNGPSVISTWWKRGSVSSRLFTIILHWPQVKWERYRFERTILFRTCRRIRHVIFRIQCSIRASYWAFERKRRKCIIMVWDKRTRQVNIFDILVSF